MDAAALPILAIVGLGILAAIAIGVWIVIDRWRD